VKFTLSKRRRTSLGLVLMVLGAIGLASAVPASAGPRAPAQTAPGAVVPGNPTCGDLAPVGETWTELKVEPVTAGVHTDGTLTVTITVVDTATGPTITWSSNIGVDAVLVKGGPDGTFYLYAPESTGDSGLHAPLNPQNDMYFGLSHVSFCYDNGGVTETTSTSTTMAPTTTTTSSSTTTTTSSSTSTTTSTTAPTSTTSTTAVAPAPTTAPPHQPAPAPPHRTLPATGSNTLPMVLGSVGLLAAGMALVVGSRRMGQS